MEINLVETCWLNASKAIIIKRPVYKNGWGADILRSQKDSTLIYEFGPFCMDVSMHRLFLNGRVVHITAKLFDLLMILVKNSGEVVTKEELMKEIWPNQFVEESNLTVSMSALRKALGERYKECTYIETIPKRGYRFSARVRELSVTDPVYRQSYLRNNRGTKKPVQEKTPISLAVLPLINESGNPELEYLSDGLAESFINSLSQIPQLRVLARSSVYRYKGKELNILRTGQELNVHALVAGRVLQHDDRLLINIELIDVEDGTQLWGAKYDSPFSDIFEIQKEIATEVSEKLSLRLTLLERRLLTKRYTDDTAAYRHYLKGRFFWNKRSIKGIKKAIKYFQRAIDQDAGFTLAYSGLADCYITLAGYGVLQQSTLFPRAERAVLQALAIDDSLAEAHASLGNIRKLYNLNWEEAEKEYLKAIALNPYYATAHQWYADYLAVVGRFDEAIERINQALELEPLSLIFNKTMAKILYLAREYDKGIEWCLETLEIEPKFGPANGQLAYIYAAKGMYREAIAEIQKLINFASGDYEVPVEAPDSIFSSKRPVLSSQSDPEAIAALGYFYALAGRKDEALELAQGLEELCHHRYVEPHTLAMVYTGLGDNNRAVMWLEKAYLSRSSVITHLKVWPVLDSLRSDPRFIDLYKRVGFT